MNIRGFFPTAIEKLRPLKDRWVSPFSFLIAVLSHLLVIGLGTSHYTGASSHPERSNQAVQKLENALKKNQVRFVYVKDLGKEEDLKRVPAPGAPLSDRDRAGSSPDGGRGSSWDPRSEGSSPYRQAGAEGPHYAPPARPGGPVASRGARGASPSTQVAPKKETASRAVIREAENAKGDGEGIKPGGVDVKASENGLPVKGEGGKGTPAKSPEPSGLTSQLGEMMVQSLRGGYKNPNASRLNQGAVSFETSGWDLGPYARIVQEKVESNWRTPAVQEILRQKGWTAIHFDIMKDGRVENVEVARSSRIPSYDQAAMSALLTSSPFPPLPEQVTVPKISGTFRFFYNMWTEEEDPKP